MTSSRKEITRSPDPVSTVGGVSASRRVIKGIATLLSDLFGTTNQIIVTPVGNTIVLSTPQDIDTDADVEFDSAILGDLTASRMVSADATKKLVSIANLASWIAGTIGEIIVTDDADGTITLSLSSAFLAAGVLGTANEIDITDNGDGTIAVGIIDPLKVSKGGTGVATLTDHGIVIGSGTAAVTILAEASHGQIPIGSTGADPVLAALTGTVNQITITNAAGSITISLPQDIDVATDLLVNTINAAYIQLVATGNVSLGDAQTMDSLTTGNINTVIGAGGTGTSLTIANGNILIGYSCGNFLKDTDNNIIIGRNAGYSQVSPETCVIIGYGAGQSGVDTTRAVYVGHQAGGTIKGGEANVFIGYNSGRGHNPVSGTADGTTANHLIDSSETFLTDGIVKSGMVIQNTDDDTETTITAVADGDLTLTADIFVSGEDYTIITAKGSYNVGVGRRTLYGITDGAYNIAVGQGAGIALRSGDSNTLLGSEAGELLTDEDYNIYIGNRAGKFHKLDDRLIIDAYTRTSQALEITSAIIYGVMSAAIANQTLRLNAKVGINVNPTASLHLPAGTTVAGTAALKLTEGALLTTQEVGTFAFSGGKLYFTNVANRRVLDRTSDVNLTTVTVANTITETVLWTGPMAADSLRAGNIFKFHADGVVSNNGASAVDEVTIRIRVGGIAGGVVATLNPNTKALTNVMWHLDANATQRTIGAGGSRAVHMHLVIGDPISTGDEVSVTGIAAINTTANMDVVITAQWASAKAANTISLYQGFMEYKN